MTRAAPGSRRPVLRRAAVALALALPSIVTWLYFVRLSGAAPGVQQAVYAAGKTLQFALPVAVVAALLGRRPRLGRPSASGLLEGLLSGIAMFVAVLVAFGLAERYEPNLVAGLAAAVRSKVADLGIASPVRYGAVAVFYSLIHSALEEYYWRWFVFGQTRRMLTVRPATVLAALGFMAHHVILVGVYSGWNAATAVPASLAIAAAGAYWCWLYERSGSLAGPWLSHVLIDAAIFAVGWRLL